MTIGMLFYIIAATVFFLGGIRRHGHTEPHHVGSFLHCPWYGFG